MDKTDYEKRLLTMLEDNTTYQQLQKDPTLNTEKTVNEFVPQLVAENKITKIQSYRLKSSNGRAPVLYGLPKLHKQNQAAAHRIFYWLSDLQFIKGSGTNSSWVDRKKQPPYSKFERLCKIYHIYYHKPWWTNGVFW